MKTIGLEYRGKLPPGAEKQLAKSLERFREAQRTGLRITVRILPGPGSAAGEALAHRKYSVDSVPSLRVVVDR